jgi:uncharacterized membrane protein YdjX (TVP38/TMEM64 family)
LSPRWKWGLAGAAGALVAGLAGWLVRSRIPIYGVPIRLLQDPEFLRNTLQAWGPLAPVIFILVQALQVVMAPIPGEVTGLLGGYAFGLRLGFVYSTVGLTIGSLFAFWVGRRLGGPFVRRLVSPRIWDQMGFIVEAEGAVLCFIIYLIPGLPKDIVCYLFGLSPMPFWVFAVVSTLGRMPGTWALSAQGAQVASGHYLQLFLLTAIVAAAAVPLYWYRAQILAWVRGRPDEPTSSRGRRSV